MVTYLIPFEGKYLVYRPLRKLAFIANAAMVNLIARLRHEPGAPISARDGDAYRFLSSIGFFEPDPPVVTTEPKPAAFKPTVAVCLLTNACNFRCIYCYASGGEGAAKEELPFDLGRQAIDIVCRNAVEKREQSFTLGFHGGGEPTLARGSFRRLVEYARGKSLPCQITVASNGYWSESQRGWILDRLDQVSLSFDGTRAMQDRQRPLSSGKSTFSVVMETIRAMDRRNFPYGIRMTVTDAGIEELPSAVEFLCRETQCGTFQVEPAFDQGRARSNEVALGDNRRFADVFLQAYDVAYAQGRHLYYSGARPWVITERFCRAIDNALIVAPDGSLTACYEVYGREHPLGRTFFFGSLGTDGSEKVEAQTRSRLQHQIAERRALCAGCFCYWHCAGDCPPKTLTPDSDGHRQFGPRCDLNRLITENLLVRYIAAGQGVWRGDSAMQPTL